MGDFGGKRWRPYLDEEAQKIRDEKLQHLKENYEGPSDFIKKKLKEEKVLDIEERIRRAEKDLEEEKERLEKLKQVKKERDQQDRLRDKKQLLKDKQERLKEIQESGMSEEAVRKRVRQRQLKRKPPRYSDEEYLEMKSDRVDRMVENRLESQSDLDELVEEVRRLQGQVEELNGGEGLPWFMDLDAEDMEKSEVEQS